MRYSQWWTEKAPTDLVDRHACTAFQVMLGRHWRLLVIDLDGQAAVEWWESNHGRRTPRTWITHSGGGGRHLWFRLPEHYARPLPKAVLWTDGRKHSAAERLCDGSLIVAPPSVHPKTGRRYRFLSRLTHRSHCPCPHRRHRLLHIPTITRDRCRAACPVLSRSMSCRFRQAPQDGRYRRGDPGQDRAREDLGRAIHRAENAEGLARMPRDFTAG